MSEFEKCTLHWLHFTTLLKLIFYYILLDLKLLVPEKCNGYLWYLLTVDYNFVLYSKKSFHFNITIYKKYSLFNINSGLYDHFEIRVDLFNVILGFK